jgi:hypothetical protein
MHNSIPLGYILPPLTEALRTDPWDLEVIWNIGVLQNQSGNKEGSRNTLQVASKLAPGNALIARALNEFH